MPSPGSSEANSGTGLEGAEIAAEQTVDLAVPVAVTAAVEWSATLVPRRDAPYHGQRNAQADR